MGNTCCSHVLDPQDDMRVAGGAPQSQLTSEEFVNSLAKIGRPDGSLSINLDLVETILLTEEDKGKREVSHLPQDEVPAGTGHRRVSFQGEQLPGQAPPAETPSKSSRVKARKGTGYVTKEKLLNLLDKRDDEEEEGEEGAEEEDEESGAETDAEVHASPKDQPATGFHPSTPAVAGEGDKKSRCKARKGTGFVSKASLQKVLVACGEE
eukprot:CAMPEP_0170602216 /NCGR_PEP_ID=MMETSP0224-20130122/18274_1 /TAXON_ID=285029 /ORGANISM="Togula jolla, Strain CCCM 725" /LENGTH=208 /DNA_ID=CAMNT_0010927043 /DNA_START=45 /DNA_END=671 /DNA_ORIENTATION=+